MGGILLLSGFLLCGVIICDALFSHRSGLVRLWLGLCMGLMLMMWLPVPFAYVLDFTRTAQLPAILSAALLAALATWGKRFIRRGAPLLEGVHTGPGFLGGMPAWLPIVLIVPLVLLSGYLQYTHVLRNVDGALYVGQSTYGDLCLHLGIATGLRNASFPPDYTILPGTLLGYPFLADSMVTSMLLLGSDLALSFTLTGTLMMALVYTGFVLFVWELTHKSAAVVLAYVLMFFNGGLGFLYVFDGAMKEPTALKNVFTGFYQTPTNMPDLNLRWVNVICDMMIPQRTLLTGWMVLLPALFMLLDAVRSRDLRRFALLGAWAGLMPMVHTHSFFALGLLSGGVLLSRVLRASARDRLRRLRCYLCYGGIALLLALPQLLTWTFPQTTGGGSLGFRFNWVNNQGDGSLIDGYFWFWIKNVGLVYLLMLPAALSMRKGGMLRALSLGALAIYAVAECIQFQPNPYDNNKLFYVAYMIMLPAVALYLLQLWEKLRGVHGRAMLAALFIGASTLSGALSIGREVVSNYQLFGAEEVQAASFIDENLPADAMILTGDQHNNAVAALAGRHIVCGTGSYLYYHGFDTTEERSAEAQMLAHPGESADLFEEYGVDYIYISGHERANFSAGEAWFLQNCYLIYDEGGVRIFALDEEDALRALGDAELTVADSLAD